MIESSSISISTELACASKEFLTSFEKRHVIVRDQVTADYVLQVRTDSELLPRPHRLILAMKMTESSMPADEKRRLMARFRGKDTKPEMLIRRELHRRGYRFRIHRKDLPGKPDIVLPRYRTAIFVHGCFWHHHVGCAIARIPKSREQFWREKFERNQARDERNASDLQAQGWTVVTVWECAAVSRNLGQILDEAGLFAKERGRC